MNQFLDSNDIDECALQIDNCPMDINCTNTIGSYTCECDPGFCWSEQICSKDECELNIHNCDIQATCINTPDSYKCSWDAGFTGDGFPCLAILGCPAGEHLTPEGKCIKCPLNTYSNLDNNTLSLCIICTDDYLTGTNGTISIIDCKCKFIDLHVVESVDACEILRNSL